MYNLKFSSEFLKELQVLDSRYPGISNKINSLSENPTSIAIPTNLPVFSQYYVNAGNRHVILFDIDEQDKIIEFNAIFHTSRLYRLLNENKEAPE